MSEDKDYEDMDIDNMSDEQLKEELESRGLEIDGTRDELILKIKEHDHLMYENEIHEENDDHLDKSIDEQDSLHDHTIEEREDENDFVVWAEADDGIEDEKQQNLITDDANDPSVENSAENNEVSLENSFKDEYSVDLVKDKDILNIKWRGVKILVPCRDEVAKELRQFSRNLNIIAYPVSVEDLYTESVSNLLKSAVNVALEVDELGVGLSVQGFIRLKFQTLAEVAHAKEVFKSISKEDREIIVQNYGEGDSEEQILVKVRGKNLPHKDSLIHRLLFVSNLPEDITEDELKEHFSDCKRVIVPQIKEESTEKICYAFIEFHTESATSDALAKYKERQIKSKDTYVIRAVTGRKETMGLSKDGLRKYWLEQVKLLTASKEKANKNVKEINEVEQKLNRYKKRINIDNKTREDLGFPIPKNEIFEISQVAEELISEKDSKTKSISKTRENGKDRIRSRRYSPPLAHKKYSPRRNTRGRTAYRGHQSKYESHYRGSSRAPIHNPNNLVDQLHHLVGVLSNKLPIDPPRYAYPEPRYSDSRGPSRDLYAFDDIHDSRSKYDKRYGAADHINDRKRKYPDDDYINYERGHNDYRGGYRGNYNYR